MLMQTYVSATSTAATKGEELVGTLSAGSLELLLGGAPYRRVAGRDTELRHATGRLNTELLTALH
jgi:hypothetical protein